MTQIGTQAFGLAKEMDRDLTSTLRKLHEIGFSQIEPFVLFRQHQGSYSKNLWTGETLNIALPILRELGMSVPSVHIGIASNQLSMPVKMIVENILDIHSRTGFSTFVVSGMFHTLKQTKHWARLLNAIEKDVHDSGIQIVYHNHDDEFANLKLKSSCAPALDLFFALAGPDIKLQLDIGWASLAGDEEKIAEKYADRIVSLHLKDFYPAYQNGSYRRQTMPKEAFAPIGSGGVKLKEILVLRNRLPDPNVPLIIDQDQYTGDMMESLKTGYNQIRSILREL